MRSRRALLVYTNTDWPATALFPKALAEAGFGVYVYCPAEHPVTFSRYIKEWFAYPPPIEVATFNHSLAALVARWEPDILLAGDDTALWLLHRLRLDDSVLTVIPALAEVLARSLGRPDRVLDLEKKSRLSHIARALDIPMAAECVDPTPEQAEAFAAEHGWPVVVKLDFTWAGTGVRFAHNRDQLLSLLKWRPDIATLDPRTLILARFLGGVTYEMAYSAWRGRLLGCLGLEKVRILPGGGSAVVKRGGDALIGAVGRLVSHFGLSGVGDVEFRVDIRTGTPCLLEVNPRIVPTTRVAPLYALDLCGLLRDAIDGKVDDAVRAGQPLGRDGSPLQVALFPSEWRRDASSRHLVADVHDAPWDDPRLLVEMTRRFTPLVQRPPAPDEALFSTTPSEKSEPRE